MTGTHPIWPLAKYCGVAPKLIACEPAPSSSPPIYKLTGMDLDIHRLLLLVLFIEKCYLYTFFLKHCFYPPFIYI